MFWGETLTQQIADDNANSDELGDMESSFNRQDPNANSKSWNDTLDGLTMLQSSPASKHLKIGNSIAVYDDVRQHWRAYRIYQTDETIDSISGAHLVTVDAINLAIYKLGKTVPQKKDEIKEANLKQVMSWIMAGTGWSLENNATSGELASFSFDGSTTSQSYLQTALTTFDCECDAYLHMDESGIVTDLILELVDQLGENKGRRITYGDNMLSIQRETVDTNLISKLYVYGSSGLSIATAKGVNGKDFLVDRQANSLYNNDPNTWLEGTITSSNIARPEALRDWGMQQLKLYNHPRVNYTVDTTPDFDANLGDTIKVIDLAMTPVLTTQARVIQKIKSVSDPSQNKVVLGEFSTVTVVTPNFIYNMEQRWGDHVKKLLDDAIKNGGATVSLITPMGVSWYNSNDTKRIIARLFVQGENLTAYLKPEAFIWEKYNTDGSRDTEWENKQKAGKFDLKGNPAKDVTGYAVEIPYPCVGTIVCSIDSDYIAKDADSGDFEAEIWVENGEAFDGSFLKVWETFDSLPSVPATPDIWGNNHTGGLQYCYWLSNRNVLASYSYGSSSDKNPKPKASSLGDTEFIMFDSSGKVLSAMLVHGGGHGGSFGYNEKSNTIYTVIKDPSTKKYWLCSLAYSVNMEIDINSASVTKYCEVGQYLRVSYDTFADLWLVTAMDGTVDVLNHVDIRDGKYNPIIEFKLSNIGLKPLQSNSTSDGTNDGTFNTMQANGFRYPFAFFSSGDANNSDDKLLTIVNVITQSVDVKYIMSEGQSINISIPIEDGGKLEPEGVYPMLDSDGFIQKLIMSFNISEYRNNTSTTPMAQPHSAIYQIPIGIRQDANMLVAEYPPEDMNTPNSEVAYEIGTNIPADISDLDPSYSVDEDLGIYNNDGFDFPDVSLGLKH